MSKSFLLNGSYKKHLPIREMNKEARRYWKKIDAIKKQDELEKKKLLLKCWIITPHDLAQRC